MYGRVLKARVLTEFNGQEGTPYRNNDALLLLNLIWALVRAKEGVRNPLLYTSLVSLLDTLLVIQSVKDTKSCLTNDFSFFGPNTP